MYLITEVLTSFSVFFVLLKFYVVELDFYIYKLNVLLFCYLLNYKEDKLALVDIVVVCPYYFQEINFYHLIFFLVLEKKYNIKIIYFNL